MAEWTSSAGERQERKTVTGRGARSPSGKSGMGAKRRSFRDASGLRAAETAGEFLDAARGIDKFLLAGEERMAGGANADLEVAPGGAHMVEAPQAQEMVVSTYFG